MEKYKYLDHTADVLFEAYGSTFEEALENSADAMLNIIANNLKTKQSFEFEVFADTKEDLVVQTLSTLIAQSDSNEMILSKFKIEKLEKGDIYHLVGRAFGEPFGKNKKVKTIVKGVTYHELLVEEKPKKVRIRVLLDV
ncbi:archease [Candidatus Micrarchaeota archaeon]|nr:archease [Candidatus Micrarchaeota archaeon]